MLSVGITLATDGVLLVYILLSLWSIICSNRLWQEKKILVCNSQGYTQFFESWPNICRRCCNHWAAEATIVEWVEYYFQSKRQFSWISYQTSQTENYPLHCHCLGRSVARPPSIHSEIRTAMTCYLTKAAQVPTLEVAYICIVLKQEYFTDCRLQVKLPTLGVLCGHFIKINRNCFTRDMWLHPKFDAA